MKNKIFALMTLLILMALTLAACGGDDSDEGDGEQQQAQEQGCIDPVNVDNLPTNYDLDLEASFESGVTYNFPDQWTQDEVSETLHELRIPQAPPIVFRIVDTGELRALGLPESVSASEADFDRYADAFYEGQQKLGFSSGTALGSPFAEGQFRLPCEGEATIRLFNNAEGRIMAIDLRSDSGPIPTPFDTVKGNLVRALAGQ